MGCNVPFLRLSSGRYGLTAWFFQNREPVIYGSRKLVAQFWPFESPLLQQ